MPAIRFGLKGKQLFGFHHAPTRGNRHATSVLLCNPFAQEALRAQRMFRMLGERLERSGFHVLRFDYYATGDSDGDCEAADLEQSAADILSAHRELQARSSIAECAWIGLGLGATLAARASMTLERPLAALVLWEPVFDGARYLEDLGAMHDRHFSRALDASCQPPAAADDPSSAIVDQLLGYPLSLRLKQQFSDLAEPLPSGPRAKETTLLVGPHDAATRGVAPRWLKTAPIAGEIAQWGATDFDDIVASAIVYNDVVRTVADVVGKLP